MSVDHYENFPVASILCPPRLRPAVRAIYAYARTADDLADEGDATASRRLADLAAYRRDLACCAAGQATSERWRSVFEPLQATIRVHRLPVVLLDDLLSAFIQDVTVDRYPDRPSLLDYCRRSANPVGRLLLHLYGVGDTESLRRSDAICTALQLVNFWQDLGVDTARGRLYLPLADCARHGVEPRALLAGEDGPHVRSLVADVVGWARGLMLDGAPLAVSVQGRAGWELRFVVQGGLRIAEKIERNGFDALRRRPTVAAADAPALLWRALTMRRRLATPAAGIAT